MQAWKLFAHSVRQVFGNPGAALRISVVLSVLLYGAWALLVVRKLPVGLAARQQAMAHDPALIRGMLLTTLGWLVATLWIAVGWHRFILRNEQPWRIAPRLRVGRMLAYFGRILLVLLLVLLAVFSIVVALGALIYLLEDLLGLGAMLGGFADVIIVLPAALIAAWVFNRLAPLLPAAALGVPLTLREAWRATAGQSGTLVLVGLLYAVLIVLLDLPSLLFAAMHLQLFQIVWATVAGGLHVIVGASLLTTIYGHYIEKRPLVGAAAKG